MAYGLKNVNATVYYISMGWIKKITLFLKILMSKSIFDSVICKSKQGYFYKVRTPQLLLRGSSS